MRYILIMAAAALLLVSIAGALTNSYYLNSATPVELVAGYWGHDYPNYYHGTESNQVSFSGSGNTIKQYSTYPAWGAEIYQSTKNRIDVHGSNNYIEQKNELAQINRGTESTIRQDLFNYADVNGDWNTLSQYNFADARVAPGSIPALRAQPNSAFIYQTETNLAYIGQGGLSSDHNKLYQANDAQAYVYDGTNQEITQHLSNFAMQFGDYNELYQGRSEENSVYSGSNLAEANIGGDYSSMVNPRPNFNTIDQTLSNTAIQRNTDVDPSSTRVNKAYQQNWAISNIKNFDYNTITQAQANSLTQEGYGNILMQGYLNVPATVNPSAKTIGSNYAKATIEESCKAVINQEQTSRGYQAGENADSELGVQTLQQGTTANALIQRSASDYLTPQATIEQNQDLLATQGGTANELIQKDNTATAEIIDSSGAEIVQNQMSNGAQGASGNSMTQTNAATGSLYWAYDYEIQPDPFTFLPIADMAGNYIKQDQKNRGEQSVSSENVLSQSNTAKSYNYINDPTNYLNDGLNDKSEQSQSNIATQYSAFGTTISPTKQYISQSNEGTVRMPGQKDETTLKYSNIASWKGINPQGNTIGLTQSITLNSKSDPNRADYDTDIIDYTLMNVCRLNPGFDPLAGGYWQQWNQNFDYVLANEGSPIAGGWMNIYP